MMLHSINCKALVQNVACAVIVIIAVWLMDALPAASGVLNVGGQWGHSESSSGDSVNSQKYNISYTGRADITDRILVNGSVRYNKNISTDADTDSASSSLSLINTNELYRFSINGSYSYSTQKDGSEFDSWSWVSRVDSNWENSLWPQLGILLSQTGSESDGNQSPVSSNIRLDSKWNYWQWLQLGYNFSWNRTEASGSSGESQNLQHAANMKISRSFWDNRGSFSFTQGFWQSEAQNTSIISSGGFGLVEVPVSQIYYEEIQDPSDNVLTNDASFLFTDEQPPITLSIDPNNKPMNLILFTASQDVAIIRLYTTNDIENFYQGVAWRAYQSPNGTDSWTQVANGMLGVGDYDQTEHRITIDLGPELNSEYVKIVLELPDPVFDVPPGETTNLERVEVFRKVFGITGTSVTDTTETKSWVSGLTMGYRLTDSVHLSYNAKYDLRQGGNTKERRSLANSGSLLWMPRDNFRVQAALSENRLEVEEQEERINRNYSLSLFTQPLATLDLSSAFSRNETITGSTLEKATHSYTMRADAELYRDLHGSLTLAYSNIQTGEGSDSLSSALLITARFSPTLLFDWNSNNNLDLDTNIYSMDNKFSLNWRISEYMNMSSSINTSFVRGEDLTSGLHLNIGITPNKKNRIALGYTIVDEEDVEQSMTGSWKWIISKTFDFDLSGSYLLAEKNSWFMTGTLKARFSN